MKYRNVVGLVVVSMVGASAVALATKQGVGLSPDSITYISSARNLAKGQGLTIASGHTEQVPLTHYPPLLPSVLALVSLLGVNELAGARYVNIIAYGANIFLFGLILHRYTRHGWTALFGAVLCASSVPLLDVHLWAWSEPIFIVFLLLTIWSLAEHIEHPRFSWLVLAGVAASLAFLTRYAGAVCVLLGGCGLLLLQSKVRWLRRVLDVLVFGVLSCTGAAVWLLRNYFVAGTLTNRQAHFHPLQFKHLEGAWKTLLSWMPPSHWFRLAALLFGIAMALGMWVLAKAWRRKSTLAAPPAKLRKLPHLLMMFVAMYVVLILFTISFFDNLTGLDARMLSPVYLALLCVLLLWTDRAFYFAVRWRAGQILAVAACLTLAVVFCDRTIDRVSYVGREGLGYATKFWRTSPTIAEIKKLPQDTIIYSNGPDVVYLLTGRRVSGIPAKARPTTGQPKQNYESLLVEMTQKMKDQQGVLAYFDRITWRWYLPSKQELEQKAPLIQLGNFTDGTIYCVKQ